MLNAWIYQPHFEIHHISPAWFIPVVGNILAPVAGVTHGALQISWFYFISWHLHHTAIRRLGTSQHRLLHMFRGGPAAGSDLRFMLDAIFRTQPLSLLELGVCFGLAALALVAVEFERWLCVLHEAYSDG